MRLSSAVRYATLLAVILFILPGREAAADPFDLVLRSPLATRIQRRIFFGVPLPPLDPAFRFREPLGVREPDPVSASAVRV